MTSTHAPRTIERRVAAVAVGAAVLFTAHALVWRFGIGERWWPTLRPPPFDPSGFAIYPWLKWLLAVGCLAALLGCVVRWMTGWRGATAWIAAALPILACAATALLYVPLFDTWARRVDRIAGAVREPVPAMQAATVAVMVTLGLAAMFVLVTRMRHAPPFANQAALITVATLAAVLLHLLWILLVFPISNQWTPAEWNRPDQLVSFRPCRGAMLWVNQERHVLPLAHIDEIWLRFSDPRRGGAEIWAISASGEWREEYLWLNRAEAAKLWMRRDDPAVVNCDSRARPDRVAPAAWHRLGSHP